MSVFRLVFSGNPQLVHGHNQLSRRPAHWSIEQQAVGKWLSQSWGPPQTGTPSVTNVSYNAADQMTSMTHNGLAERRQYDSLFQLTRITIPGQMDLEYRYSASANNGQITQMKNWISGEEVNYGYDAVGRLSTAITTGPEWGLSFTYDGFGNKTAQTVTKGTAPAMSVGIDANNRVVGWTYDKLFDRSTIELHRRITYDAIPANRLSDPVWRREFEAMVNAWNSRMIQEKCFQ